MNVFKHAITALVILTAALFSSSAHALWRYPVDPPAPPIITRVVTLNNPTVAQIRSAIAPHTRIYIRGTVGASNGGTINIHHNDVQLNFINANVVNWRGGDTWDGFINIYAQRVQIVGLRFTINDGPGRCRGIMIGSPARDIRIARCSFNKTADGLVGDGEWAKLAITNCEFLNCSNWVDQSMPGGYGIFLEDDDMSRDDLMIVNVTITLASNSGQHGMRLSQVQNGLIHNCRITANDKRSFWAYGVDCLAIRRSTFTKGSVLFNLMTHEYFTTRPTTRVRIDSCRIEHTGILQPLGVYCGRGTRDFIVRDLDVTSTSSPRWALIGWRGQEVAKDIQWYDRSVTFNGHVINGYQDCDASDWTAQEHYQLKIGPMPDPR